MLLRRSGGRVEKWRRLGCSADPFAESADPAAFYAAPSRAALLSSLVGQLRGGPGGVFALLGEAGSGKTMLLRAVEAELRAAKLVVIFHDCERQGDRWAEDLQAFALVRERCVLIADGAERWDESAVDLLLGTLALGPAAPGKQIVVSGAAGLEKRLQRLVAAGLTTNLTFARLRLGPIEAARIGDFLLHRLRAAGYSGPQPFTDETLHAIAERSGGLPSRILELAAAELASPPPATAPKRAGRSSLLAASLALLVAAAVLVWRIAEQPVAATLASMLLPDEPALPEVASAEPTEAAPPLARPAPLEASPVISVALADTVLPPPQASAPPQAPAPPPVAELLLAEPAAGGEPPASDAAPLAGPPAAEEVEQADGGVPASPDVHPARQAGDSAPTPMEPENGAAGASSAAQPDAQGEAPTTEAQGQPESSVGEASTDREPAQAERPSAVAAPEADVATEEALREPESGAGEASATQAAGPSVADEEPAQPVGESARAERPSAVAAPEADVATEGALREPESSAGQASATQAAGPSVSDEEPAQPVGASAQAEEPSAAVAPEADVATEEAQREPENSIGEATADAEQEPLAVAAPAADAPKGGARGEPESSVAGASSTQEAGPAVADEERAPPGKPSMTASAPPAPTAPRPEPPRRALSAERADAYLRRAQDYLRTGDVAAARLLYERVAEAGDPRAMRELARTYDPAALREWGVVGLAGEPERAEHWRRRAVEAEAAPNARPR